MELLTRKFIKDNRLNCSREKAIDALCNAKRVGVLTGAGISAESGIATFRGEDGLWNKLNPEELAGMSGFLKNPQLVWEWYQYRRNIIENVKPNAAHIALAEMESFYPEYSISTQNIDGLHQRAGSQTVFELHGNILRNRCMECGVTLQDDHIDEQMGIPKCSCGGLVRPNVVWFGEPLPESILTTSFEVARHADVYFSIGTSAAVYPAAYLPIEALYHGAFVIEINLEPTELTPLANTSLQGKAGEMLPALWQDVKCKVTA